MNSLNRIFVIVLMLKPIQFLKIIFVSVVNKEAHKKFKIFKQNPKPHFNQNPRKQIMIMSCLKRKANNSKDPMGITKFKRQGNLVVKLNKQVKLQRFQKLSVDSNSKSF